MKVAVPGLKIMCIHIQIHRTFDKVSACSSAFEDMDVDIEADSTTPLSISGRGNDI